MTNGVNIKIDIRKTMTDFLKKDQNTENTFVEFVKISMIEGVDQEASIKIATRLMAMLWTDMSKTNYQLKDFKIEDDKIIYHKTYSDRCPNYGERIERQIV